jgi:phosphate transport system substrate-binding protein
MTRSRRPLVAVLVAAITVALAATLVPPAIAKTTISMSGSTSVAPLARKLASGYLKDKKLKGKLGFKLFQGQSDVGIADVAKGRVTIGNASRAPKASDPGGLVFNKIAKDALCVVTNKANPISNISQATIQNIFTGKVKRWSQVPGATANGTIKLVSRTAASGTQDAFQNIFLGPTLREPAGIPRKASNGLQAQAVKADPNAIGYASFNFTKGLNAVPYKGVKCNLRNAKSGQYGGARFFYMVTRGKAKGAAKAWIRWIRRDSTAKKIVSTDWVPIR